MKRLSIVIFLTFVLAPIPRLKAQGQTGTLIVVYSSNDEIAVASDSRTHNEYGYLDNRCKITALGNRLLFVASGRTGFGPLDGSHPVWSSANIARERYNALKKRKATPDLALTLAKLWGNEAKKQLKRDLVRDREATIENSRGHVLSLALFAKIDPHVNIEIIEATISYRFREHGKPKTELSIQNINVDGPISIFMGDIEAANELWEGRTARAIEWQAKMRKEFNPEDDWLTYKAAKTVEFAVQFDDGKIINGQKMLVIGGPIDLLRLVRDRGVEWLQRKPNCPAD